MPPHFLLYFFLTSNHFHLFSFFDIIHTLIILYYCSDSIQINQSISQSITTFDSGFDWGLHFRWEPLTEAEAAGRSDPTSVYR